MDCSQIHIEIQKHISLSLPTGLRHLETGPCVNLLPESSKCIVDENDDLFGYDIYLL